MRKFLPPVPEPLPDRAALNWLLASSVLAVAPLGAWLPLWLPAVAALLLFWRFAHARRGWPIPGRWLRVALTLLVLFAVYRQFGTLFGRNAGLALLVLLLALKLFELKRLRDYMLCVLLLYFLIAGSFLYAQTLWLALYQLAALTVCSATLVRLTQPDLGGARAALTLAGVLLLKAAPLVLVLYLLFPRIQGSLWGMPLDAYGALSGLSEEMHPGSVNYLSQSEEVVFRAAFEGERPASGALYWRALVLWDSDGHGWLRGPAPGWPAQSYAASGPPSAYTVTLEPGGKPWLPALDLPVAAPERVRLSPAFTLELGAPLRERRQYRLLSYTNYQTRALQPAERERALRLPSDASARMHALAREWRAAAREDDAEVVRAALGHFRRENFVYTLEPPLLGDDPVDEFLFDTRRGFCEHYTSAFVTLMRAAGVPARVVLGYQGGELNPAGGYLIVRQSDAHAWAEVWLAGRGWVRVDPTSAVAPERIEYGAPALRRLHSRGLGFGRLPPEALRLALQLGWLEGLTRHGRLAWDSMNDAWNRWVPGYSEQRQHDLLRDLGIETPTGSVLVGLLGLLALGVLATLAFFMRRARPVRDPVQTLYRVYCRKLGRAGLERAPHEGPLDFARRCAGARTDLEPAIERINRLYLGLRYGAAGTGTLRDLRRRIAAFRT